MKDESKKIYDFQPAWIYSSTAWVVIAVSTIWSSFFLGIGTLNNFWDLSAIGCSLICLAVCVMQFLAIFRRERWAGNTLFILLLIASFISLQLAIQLHFSNINAPYAAPVKSWNTWALIFCCLTSIVCFAASLLNRFWVILLVQNNVLSISLRRFTLLELIVLLSSISMILGMVKFWNKMIPTIFFVPAR